MRFTPHPGQHIEDAISHALEFARDRKDSVSFTFNGANVTVVDTDLPTEVLSRWQAEMDREAAKYRASPAGIRATQEAAQRLADHQRRHDALMAQLPEVAANEPKLIEWLADFAEVADSIGVTGKDYPRVTAALIGRGYRAGEACGLPKERYKEPHTFARYLVGQALSCMADGMGPHPIMRKFADEYAALAPQVS